MKQIKITTSKGEFLIAEMPVHKKNLSDWWDMVPEVSLENFRNKICLQSITEEQAGEIVDKVMNNQHFQNYNYKCVTDRWCKTAIESLHSLIKSKGIYLFKNPMPLLSHHRLEAEQKTFYNPYIFKL